MNVMSATHESGEDFEEVSPIQAYLLDGYYRWAGRKFRRSNSSERAFAMSLGVKPSTWSNWMSRGGKPDFYHCVILSRSKNFGPEIFDLCGYPRVYVLDDRAKTILENWEDVGDKNGKAFIDELRRAAGAQPPEPGGVERSGPPDD